MLQIKIVFLPFLFLCLATFCGLPLSRFAKKKIDLLLQFLLLWSVLLRELPPLAKARRSDKMSEMDGEKEGREEGVKERENESEKEGKEGTRRRKE